MRGEQSGNTQLAGRNEYLKRGCGYNGITHDHKTKFVGSGFCIACVAFSCSRHVRVFGVDNWQPWQHPAPRRRRAQQAALRPSPIRSSSSETKLLHHISTYEARTCTYASPSIYAKKDVSPREISPYASLPLAVERGGCATSYSLRLATVLARKVDRLGCKVVLLCYGCFSPQLVFCRHGDALQAPNAPLRSVYVVGN
jgi:hypothetical protein